MGGGPGGVMELGLLSDSALNPMINWTTILPALFSGLVLRPGDQTISPPPLAWERRGEWSEICFQVKGCDALFWVRNALAGRRVDPPDRVDRLSPRRNPTIAPIGSRSRGRALRLGDTKTGYSVRPIGLAALEALSKAMTHGKSEFVFPGTRGTVYFQGVDKVCRIMAGQRLPNVTPHVLRHSFASTADDIGLTVPTIAALLGHAVSGSATLGYIHKLDAALISAANRVAARVAASMNGIRDDGPVVAFRRVR
jgi:hypothetical protein